MGEKIEIRKLLEVTWYNDSDSFTPVLTHRGLINAASREHVDTENTELGSAKSLS